MFSNCSLYVKLILNIYNISLDISSIYPLRLIIIIPFNYSCFLTIALPIKYGDLLKNGFTCNKTSKIQPSIDFPKDYLY